MVQIRPDLRRSDSSLPIVKNFLVIFLEGILLLSVKHVQGGGCRDRSLVDQHGRLEIGLWDSEPGIELRNDHGGVISHWGPCVVEGGGRDVVCSGELVALVDLLSYPHPDRT